MLQIDFLLGSGRDRSWPDGPEISHVPLRKVISRASHISNGRFRSYKHPTSDVAMIDAESDGELLFLRFAEMDPNVEAIVSQPTRLVPHVEGVAFDHVPDFALIADGRAQIHEVKSGRWYDDPMVRSRLVAAAEYVEGWPDWDYLVAPSSSLYDHPKLAAVTDLWRRHRRIWTKLQRRAILDHLVRRDAIIADVAAALAIPMGDHAPSERHILSLAAGGQIFINLDHPVGPTSMIRFPDQQALPPTLLPSIRPEPLRA
ncbi:hypothetical protein LPN01_15230 [Sphingomonas sp. A2-49]|uniref:hypothetical protein n=1 Tax=Sphingomonas sp. A2-49 TaxID=1391375 RepID=UPI0021D0930C|nr:hypothetical protein [Sphingomonas sp. A2-49]MCU6455433.1 hypothetical protein [Sphingomonas sp. A2-49]